MVGNRLNLCYMFQSHLNGNLKCERKQQDCFFIHQQANKYEFPLCKMPAAVRKNSPAPKAQAKAGAKAEPKKKADPKKKRKGSPVPGGGKPTSP